MPQHVPILEKTNSFGQAVGLMKEEAQSGGVLPRGFRNVVGLGLE